MRRWLNENGATVTIVALGLMVFSLFAIARQNRRPSYNIQPQWGYFADPVNGAIFTAEFTGEEPPLAPSGQQALRVYVFSCGDCGDPQQQYVGWVERLELRQPRGEPAPPAPTDADTTSPAEQARTSTAGEPSSAAAPTTQPWAGGPFHSTYGPRYRRYIRRPDDTDWVRIRSEAGAAIMLEAQERCGDAQMAMPCSPDPGR